MTEATGFVEDLGRLHQLELSICLKRSYEVWCWRGILIHDNRSILVFKSVNRGSDVKDFNVESKNTNSMS